jgi:hypothetical protein
MDDTSPLARAAELRAVLNAPPDVLRTAAERLADAVEGEEDLAWNEAFDAQLGVCREVGAVLDKACSGRGDRYAAALISYVLEGLAERQRAHMHLPSSLTDAEARARLVAQPETARAVDAFLDDPSSGVRRERPIIREGRLNPGETP